MKKIILLGLLSLQMVLADSTVIATIGAGNTIIADDLQNRINGLPAQYVSYYSSPEGKQKLLDQMIEEKMLYLESKNGGYEKNSEVLSAVEKVKEEVMTNFYIKEEMSKLTVDDKEIKDYFEKNKEKFSAPAQVRASHILVKTEEEATAALQELAKGADFAEVAKKKSTCPSAPKGGDLDYFGKGQMVEPFEKAAFALNVGETTKKPVQTQFGWHLIKVTDKKASGQKELLEVKADIRSNLLMEKQKEKLNQLIAKAKEKYTVSKDVNYLKNL